MRVYATELIRQALTGSCPVSDVDAGACVFLSVMLTLALMCCREKEIIEEREVFVVQQSEKDQQYNEIVKKLKDRVRTSRM